METGKKEAKILDKEHKKKQEDSIGVIDDDDANAGTTESGKLRSYQELQDILAEQKMKLNTEFEQITVLVENFANATTDVKINIMEDLEYYLRDPGDTPYVGEPDPDECHVGVELSEGDEGQL